MKPSREKLDKLIEMVKRHNSPEPYPETYDGLKNLIRIGLRFFPAEEANERIVELEAQVMRLQAELDRERYVREVGR